MNKNNQKTDTARSLHLLWGSQTVPGRSGLTVKRIVDTGMEIAADTGIEQLSMRKVADRLGVGTMTLYTYVPGKAELLDLMQDAAYAGLYNEGVPDGRADWQDAIRRIAETNWELYDRRPWLLALTGRRPVLGPHTSMKYERELQALDGIGLDDLEMDATLSLVLMHVDSCARQMANALENQRKTEMSEQEWWLAHEPLLGRWMDDKQFPVSSRVGQTAGEAHQGPYSPEHAYRFGLDRIIDGVGALIARKGAL